MKFTAAILATASAANSGIAGDLVAADSHFWSNAGAISQNADSILKSVRERTICSFGLQ